VKRWDVPAFSGSAPTQKAAIAVVSAKVSEGREAVVPCGRSGAVDDQAKNR